MIRGKTNAALGILTTLFAASLYACFGSGSTTDGAGGTGSGGSSGTTTPIDGGGLLPDGAPIVSGNVTYYKDVLPILQDHCQTCHVSGGIAPFSLTSYSDAKGTIGDIVTQTAMKAMPPWGAQDTSDCTPPAPWLHDMRITDDQIATFKAWQDGNTPEGDPNDAPPPPTPQPTDLPNANFTATAPTYAITSTVTDEFRCFSIDPKLLTTRYFNGAFFIPGNKEIVHHVLLYTDTAGDSAKLAGTAGSYDCFGGPGVSQPNLLAAWAPGGVPVELPPNAGAPVTAGTLLVMQVHYHPHGQDFSPDATKIQLRFSDTVPEYLAITKLIGNFRATEPNGDGLLPGPDDNGKVQFDIPANVSNHTETMRLTFPESAGQFFVYGIAGHMHLIGNAEKVWLDRADGTSQCMLGIPTWNFNWQRMYSYDAPIESLPVVKPGDKLNIQCTYNNTLSNPFMAQSLADQDASAPHDVKLGEQTTDEMCLAPVILLQKPK